MSKPCCLSHLAHVLNTGLGAGLQFAEPKSNIPLTTAVCGSATSGGRVGKVMLGLVVVRSPRRQRARRLGCLNVVLDWCLQTLAAGPACTTYMCAASRARAPDGAGDANEGITVTLTNDELARFDDEGYLFFPGRFTPAEAALLKQAADDVYATDREEVWRESSGAARTAFAAHTYHEAHRRLGRHPRLVEPVMQLLNGPVYMHQYKINAKAAFDGDVWQWHQDYGTWKRDDGMPEPLAMNVAVFLDDVTAANGPLLFIPGSHVQGVFDAGHDLETTSYPLWTLDRAKVSELAERGGCVAPTGPAGSVLLFSSLLVHASPPNISPLDRTIVYLSLCQVDNHIREFKRPHWIAHRDFTPIEPLADDCLTTLVDAASAAA